MVLKSSDFPLDYYVKAALAGGICCGVTHGALCPVDVVKTRIQLDPVKYNKGMIGGFKQVVGEECIGALASGLAGFLGMRVATKANNRTTHAAESSLAKALNVAFSGGSVMGLSVVGLGVLGLGGIIGGTRSGTDLDTKNIFPLLFISTISPVLYPICLLYTSDADDQ